MTTPRQYAGPVKVLVPNGSLGSGMLAEHVRSGIERGAHAIAVDAGSTDSGPYYLGNSISKMPRESIKRDLQIMIREAHAARIPVLIGSCGTSGTDGGVDWTCDVAVEVANELGIRPRIALLYSEQDAVRLKQANAQGRIQPLPPLGPLADETIDACHHIVALMGPEPYIRAIEEGADIVIGGRTSDPAVLAALPLMRGASVPHAWHAAKVAECGGQCTVSPRAGGVLFTIDDSGFEIEPLNMDNRCTTETVSAHLLYENSDPITLTEPGGVLDVGECVYVQKTPRSVRVTGSRFTVRPYTMKLEGAGSGRFQTVAFVGIQDPIVLRELNLFYEVMLNSLRTRAYSVFGDQMADVDISLRIYGWNGVSGQPMPDDAAVPHEVGLMMVVTAATQEFANRVAKACNWTFFHTPLRPNMKLPSYAYPFSPAEIDRGPLYEFHLNHVVGVADGLELVRMGWVDMSRNEETTHA